MTQPKTKCTFDAFLHFVAGFLVTHKNSLVNTCKSRFSHDVTEKSIHLMHYYVS